jgi:dihydropteroate synthase
MKKFLIFLLIAFFATLGFSNAETEEATLTFEEPVLITSGGQSPGALQMMVLAKMSGIEYKFTKDIEAATDNVVPYNTVIIVVGASGKGLGAAGIDVDTEIERVVELCKIARGLEKKIIIAQIEGATRRGESSDRIADAVVEYADYLLIKIDANEDEKFTKIAEEKEIPIRLFENTSDVKGILIELFLE